VKKDDDNEKLPCGHSHNEHKKMFGDPEGLQPDPNRGKMDIDKINRTTNAIAEAIAKLDDPIDVNTMRALASLLLLNSMAIRVNPMDIFEEATIEMLMAKMLGTKQSGMIVRDMPLEEIRDNAQERDARIEMAKELDLGIDIESLLRNGIPGGPRLRRRDQ
jgi:hypothetical protein